jgi:hypothetical protein
MTNSKAIAPNLINFDQQKIIPKKDKNCYISECLFGYLNLDQYLSNITSTTVNRSTRRQFLLSSSLVLSAAMFSNARQAMAKVITPTPLQRPRYLGTTFSPLQCYYMGLDYRTTFSAICTLGLNRVRLGAYWNVIQTAPDQYDFSELDWLLDQCDRHNIEVVLAVGMKVPRWPEFHFPQWVSDRHDTGSSPIALDQRSPGVADLTLAFIDRVVNHCRMAPALKYWQVENEPFTRLDIAGGRFLSADFVKREVDLVRSLRAPHQKLLLTNAIHLPQPKPAEDDPAFQDSLALADAIGLNVYTKVPAGQTGYLEPLPAFWQQLTQWQGTLTQFDRESWIAEAQAEPWEANQLVAMKARSYPSASPLKTQRLVHRLSTIGYETILLWGCEYWYWQKQQGNNLWWWTVEKMAQQSAR